MATKKRASNKQTKSQKKRPITGYPMSSKNVQETKLVRLDTRILDWLEEEQDNIYKIMAKYP